MIFTDFLDVWEAPKQTFRGFLQLWEQENRAQRGLFYRMRISRASKVEIKTETFKVADFNQLVEEAPVAAFQWGLAGTSRDATVLVSFIFPTG